MHFSYSLLVFFLQIGWSLAISNGQIPMTQRFDATIFNPGYWNAAPTWYTVVVNRHISGYQDVLDVVQECFNWLEANNRNFETQSTHTRLVAGMYDPSSGKIYVSTIPRTAWQAVLREATKEESHAPKWQAAVRRWPLGKAFHAEDSVFIDYEHSEDDAQSGQSTYPPGSIMAVWSSQNGATPREYGPCSQCQVVCKELGVIYRDFNGVLQYPPNLPNHPKERAIQRRESNIQTDDSAYTNDQAIIDWNQACLITILANWQAEKRGTVRRGNGGALLHDVIRRDNSTNLCGIPPAPTTTYIPSFTPSELPSTFQLESDTITPITISTPFPTGTPSQIVTTPVPSCSMQNPDPEAGRNYADCVCDGSITLPLISAPATAVYTMSCAYTALPTGSATTEIITTKPTLGPATTIKQSCQVCTPVDINEDSCTKIPNCVIQTARASVTAGSTAIPVGTLTGAALYTTISNALESLCPSPTSPGAVTSCSPTAEVTLKNIAYVAEEGLQTNGEVIVAIESSSYNVTSLRDALIQSIASATQWGASGNNCYIADYKIPVTQAKRSVDLRDFWPVSRMFPRQETGDPIEYENAQVTLCNTNWFQNANYYNPYWHVDDVTSPSAWISADYTFEIVIPGGEFWCEFTDFLVDAFAAIEPEYAVGDIELEEAINFFCGENPDP